MEGVSTHEERMETQGLTKMVVLDVFGHRFVHRPVGTEANQRRGYGNHVGEFQKRPVGEVRVAFLEDLLGVFKEALVAVRISLATLSNLGDHGGFVPDVIEAIAIAPNQPVHRLDLHEFDVILKSPSRQLEQIGQGVRCGDDRGPSIKREPFVFVDIGSPAGKVPGFVQHGLDAR